MIRPNARFASGAELLKHHGPKLSIVLPHCCDYKRLWHTLAGLHKDRLRLNVVDDVELLVCDNSRTVPDKAKGQRHAEEAEKRVKELPNARFVSFIRVAGTAPTKDEGIRQASGRFVICLDPHCEFPAGMLERILDWITAHPLDDDLHFAMELHLRMVEPDGKPAACCTHRLGKFGADGNFAVCRVDPTALLPGATPFETETGCCAFFLVRRASWLGFHPLSEGWGGEESYLPEKYRQAGRKVWVHPDWQYVHQYHDIDGVAYGGRDWITKARVILRGFKELSYPPLTDIKANFVQPRRMNAEEWQSLLQELQINETAPVPAVPISKSNSSLQPGEEQLLAALPCPLRWRTAGQVVCNVGCSTKTASLFDCVHHGLVTLNGKRKDLHSCQSCHDRPGTLVTAAPIEMPKIEGLPHRRLVIGVLSARRNHAKREAVRETWAGNSADDVEVLFLIGDPTLKATELKGDELWLPVPDDYVSLPHKTKAWCQWLCKNRSFGRALKCDDDTYVAIDRLLATDKGDADYVGTPLGHDQRVAHGGAGYLLSPRAVAILARDMQARSSAEDVEAWAALHAHGIALTTTTRFSAGHAVVPRPGNEQITAHYVTPERMRPIHAGLLVRSAAA